MGASAIGHLLQNSANSCLLLQSQMGKRCIMPFQIAALDPEKENVNL